MPAGNPHSDVLADDSECDGLPHRIAALAGYFHVVLASYGVAGVLDRAKLGTGLSRVNVLYSLRKPVAAKSFGARFLAAAS